MKTFNPIALGISAFIYSAMSFQVALADDTEIYVPKDLPADQQVRPNILFILDSSGSMDSTVTGTGGKSRNTVMKEVVNNLIDQLKTKEDVNIGLMRFRGLNNNNEQGGHILSPVQRLTASNAAAMKTTVNGIPASDWTPLSETYYEAYLYMTGQTPVWGKTLSVAASKDGTNYKSPISHSCQKSHIIYVTDGEPTRDVDSNADIKALVTGKNTLYPASSCKNGNGQCLPHLAEFMANQDLFPNPPASQFLDPTNRKQTVTSHFVGFAVDLPLLKDAAAAGGGKYYTSDNVSGLTDALKAIIVDITAENTSFAAPSVAVSAFNNLGYRNDLYYALFRPAEGARWPGNVKRYKLGFNDNGTPTDKTDDYPLIVDKNGNAAIDDATGFFSNSSSSFWSSSDGADVAKGGVAAQLLNPDARNMLTWTGSDRTPTASAGVSGSAPLVTLNSTNLTAAQMGAANNTERNTFVNWARGKNDDGTARLTIGDVLHNEPKLVAYTTDEDLVRVQAAAQGTATSPEKLYMFFGDNEGFIHAIDPTNGSEKFAFIPKELLKNPGAYYKNVSGSANKKYGIDGQINLWTEYSALNTGTKTRSLNKAYLYAGMRRGGSNYYALDVLNINSPQLKWVIKGPEQTLVNGNYSNATTDFTPGYAKLGRTFSAPKLAKLKVNGTETKVLIFTGGYDLDQDTIGTNEPKNDDIGNSLFVADAETGKLIWEASKSGADFNIPEMTNSMPADPTLVDLDGDGLVDIVYASDVRGQVFRFDFNSANEGSTGTGSKAFATGGRLASLAGTTAADNRRFFTSPDVALIKERGGKTYFTVSIGSGFRESPLLNNDYPNAGVVGTNDRFYVLRDSAVFTPPASYTTIRESDLTDVTGVDLTDAQAATVLAQITALETQMGVLNTALSTAQSNFTFYKTASGHTAEQNAATQKLNDANAVQGQIDTILAGDPYLLEHTPETAAQSTFQDSLTRARDVLAGVEQARSDAQTLANATDSVALTTAVADAATALTNATTNYDAAKLVSDADSANAAIKEGIAVTSESAAATAAAAFATAQTNKANADTALATAQGNATAAASADSLAASQLTTAQNDLTAKESIQTAATGDYNTAAAVASAALAAKNTADNNVTSANIAVTTATSERNLAQSDLTTAQTALNTDITTNGPPGDPSLIATRNSAQANLDTKQAALDTANSNLSTAESIAATALSAWEAADLDAATKLATKNSADADVVAATTALNAAQTTKGNTAAALTAANIEVTAKTADQTAADAALTAATTARDNTATTAGNDRSTASTAASTAAASASITATKLAEKNAAQDAKTAANQALATATTDDAAASALSYATEQLALEYEKLIKLQENLDNEYKTVTDQEAAIIAAKADPSFPSDNIPAMEIDLEAKRAAYAALSGVAKRTQLNTGSPTEAILRLDAVNAALAAGDATAIATALQAPLAALQASIDITYTPTTPLTSTALLARDEASKSAALLSKKNNEATTAALVINLKTQAAALKTESIVLQTTADTTAAKAYDESTALLSATQLAAAKAKVTPATLTTFDVYQFLIDEAQANASDPATGLPKLRSDINAKYAELTPGNNYTPNTELLNTSKGFYLRLPKGEKVLATSLSFRGSVFFSTFSPRGAATSTCGSDVGRGRTYAMSLIDASAIYQTTVGTTKTPVRSFDLKRSGIPPTPSVILSDSGKPTVLTGTEIMKEECRDDVEACRTSDAVKATYWREDE